MKTIQNQNRGAAKTECQHTPTVLRTRIYRARWTPTLDAALTKCRHLQRALYNQTIASVPSEGGRVPASQKSPTEPEGMYGQLTRWRTELEWMGAVPVVLARPAVSQARTALKLHEDATKTRTARLLEEAKAWKDWMGKNPGWDSGTWNALSAEEKRKAVAEKRAPPKSAATWRDERSGDGARTEMFRRRKTKGRCAVVWDTPPQRVDGNTVALIGLGEVEIVTNNPLPEARRLRAAKVCVKHGTRGRTRVEIHFSVLIDVVPRTKRKRKEPRIAGADMGCADTLTVHNAATITLPDHGPRLDAVLDAERTMSKCVEGSRKWREHLEVLRKEKAAMRARDHDAIRKAAKKTGGPVRPAGLGSSEHHGHGRKRPRAGMGWRCCQARSQPQDPRKPLGLHPRHADRCLRSARRAGGETPRHGLEPHLRQVRARRREESSTPTVQMHEVRAHRERRCERGTSAAHASTAVARAESAGTHRR